MQCFLQGVRVTKGKGFGEFNVAAKWQRKSSAPSPKEPWYILTNLADLSSAIDAYKMRFSIEEMFRDFKAGGYDLEGSNLTGAPLTALVILIAIAYTSAALQGQTIKQKGLQKYIGRVKEPGRVTPRHSHFYVGLYGQAWVQFMADCSEIVDQLLLLSPHKRPYYEKGRRAMIAISSVF
jgi:hypothetical protein